MDPTPVDPKRAGKDKPSKDPATDEGADEDDDDEELVGSGGDGGGGGGDEGKRRRFSASTVGPVKRGGGNSPAPPICQADKCTTDMTDAKRYHRRHKVCEAHSKAPVVVVAGLRQRFCQQCSRFHELSEFDETKRSCRRRLAGHNERRRKSSSESRGEGSSRCRQPDSGGRIQISIPGNPTYKHFHIT